MENILSTEQQSVQPQATEVPAEAAQAPVENIQQEAPANFQDLLSEELRSQANLSDFKTADDLAKSYLNAQKMIGNSIRIPSEDASPEAKADFYNKLKDLEGVIVKPTSEEDYSDYYNKLGRPSTSAEYKLDSVLESVGLEISDSINDELSGFKDLAYEMGLTNDQASKLLALRADEIKAADEAANMSIELGQKRLHEIWGQDYDNRLNAAKQVAKIYNEKYSTEMNELLNSSAANNPALLAMMSELATVYKEKGHEGMQKSNFGITPEEASNKIAEKRADKGFMTAYLDDSNPAHKQAVNEMAKLYQLAKSS